MPRREVKCLPTVVDADHFAAPLSSASSRKRRSVMPRRAVALRRQKAERAPVGELLGSVGVEQLGRRLDVGVRVRRARSSGSRFLAHFCRPVVDELARLVGVSPSSRRSSPTCACDQLLHQLRMLGCASFLVTTSTVVGNCFVRPAIAARRRAARRRPRRRGASVHGSGTHAPSSCFCLHEREDVGVGQRHHLHVAAAVLRREPVLLRR